MLRRLRLQGFLQSNLMTFDLQLLRDIRSSLKDLGLSLSQYRMLAYLSDHEEGASPKTLSNLLGISPALITSGKAPLTRGGLLKEESDIGASKRLYMTGPGKSLAGAADEAVIEACARYFSVLDESIKRTVYSGSLLTNLALHLSNKMRKGHFFEEYVTFQAFLAIETKFTDIAHSCNLSLNGFRVLLLLDENNGRTDMSSVASRLLIAPSKMTYVCNSLNKAALIERKRNHMDKRGRILAITPEGESRLAKAYLEADAYLTHDLRDSSAEELNAYMEAANSIVYANMEKNSFT